MSIIYTNFGQGLDELNRQVVSTKQLLLPKGLGRAYKFDERGNDFYGDSVHLQNVAEEHYGRIQSIRKTPNIRGGIYAGAAGMVNLSYMGALESSAGILYDVNPYQKIFWDELLSVMAETPKLEDFKAQLSSIITNFYMKIDSLESCRESIRSVDNKYRQRKMLPTKAKLRAKGTSPEDIVNRFLGGYSHKMGDVLWMDYYPHLHQIAKNNAIGAITFDVCDMAAGQQLSEFLTDVKGSQQGGNNGVDHLYISNIFNFLNKHTDWSRRPMADNQQTKNRAKENLSQIINSKTMIFSHLGVDTEFWQRPIAYGLVPGCYGKGRDLISLEL